MAKTSVSLLTEDGFKARIQSRDHVYYADEPIDKGGTDTMATPSEMAMGALGACIAITVRMYADRKKWKIDRVDVDLEMERFKGTEYPAYEGDAGFVHEIRKSIRFTGDLTDEQRERLLEIAGKCPVHRLLALPTFFVEQALAEEENPE